MEMNRYFMFKFLAIGIIVILIATKIIEGKNFK